MATITHPSMKGRAVGTSALNKQEGAIPQKTYVVDDATQNIDERLEQFSGAPQQESLSERPLMPPAQALEQAREAFVSKPPETPKKIEDRKKLESILFLGRLTKTIDFAGHRFEISTLTNREQNDIVRELYNFSEGADLFIIRTLTLANSLKSIDGIKLDDMDVYSDDEEAQFASKYQRRKDIVDNLQLSVVEKVYEEYTKLLQENDSLIAGDAIKK